MKYQGKYLYFYLGWNGLIIALDFDYKKHAYSWEFSIFGCRFKTEELEE